MSDIATTNITANITNTTPTFTANIISSGKDGTEIELQVTDTYIQWRYVDGDWANLIALADITGANGNDGADGTNGTDGVGIASVTLTSGDHSAGTTDIYTITFTDSSTTTFGVYNGLDGTGVGDMLTTIYDTNANGIVDNAEKVNSHTVEIDVPSSALFTDTVYTHPNHSGDVTSVADGAQTIANNVVTNAKLATVATATIKGRITTDTGNVEDLTATNVRSIINVADGANNYSLPTATSSVLGGIKVGNGLSIASSVLSVGTVDNLTSTSTVLPLSANQGKVLNTNKEDKVTITTDSTSTTPTKSLVTNNEYVYSNSAITTLGITLASSYSAGFIASVVFKSPSTAPTVTLTNTGSYTIATKGDGTWASLVLTPTASKTVTMIFNYDGINMNVYVSEM